MKVLLLHLPALQGLQSDDRTESLGLGYIAAVLRRDGHEVDILDASLELLDYKTALKETCAREFDCLGITAMHDHKDMLISFVKSVRKQRKDAVICAGGYLPTLATEYLLSACPEIDFLVRGEGEVVASDVFGRISRNESWHDAPGIAYIKDGVPVLNAAPPLVADLDSLPFPARDAAIRSKALSAISIYSSRGCYHRCSFCSIHTFYGLSGSHGGQRYRSAANVVDEIETIITQTGRRKFKFVDDDFIGPGDKTKLHAIGIADELLARGVEITFTIECRADEIDEALLLHLKKAGLTGVFLGIESGVQRQLDTYNKGITVEQNKWAIDLVRKLDLDMQPGFIPFDPYTTPEEFDENIRFVKEVELWKGKAAPCPLRIKLYPGVDLIEKVRADGLLIEKGCDYDYRFKSGSTRMMWNSFQTMANISRGLHKIGILRKRDDSCAS